jgi:formylglycine-generating enzyme required for sulfatase activity
MRPTKGLATLRGAATLLGLTVLLGVPAHGQRDLKVEIEGRRRALIIGNDAYTRGKLANAVNDARLMSATLTKLDFKVDTVTDASLRQLEDSVSRFAGSLSAGDIAVFYYAGHGVQIDGENYLVPIDFSGKDETDIKYGARSASWVLDKIVQSGAVLQIVVLDACRTNPFRIGRSLGGGGLAQMQGARGSFIAFATAAGKTASDDPSATNGLFTHNLVEAVNQPGLTLDEVFNRVRVAVDKASGGEQLPYIYSGVVGEFYFTAPSVPANLASAAPSPAASVSSVPAGGTPAAPGTYKENPQDGQRYVWIPPGTFTMGCSPEDKECSNNEPTWSGTIPKGFWIGQTEVTQEAYERVTGGNPSSAKGSKLPVESVTYEQALHFCRDIGMRLPAEDEWEYAARAGTIGSRYGTSEEIAWTGVNSGGKTHEVAHKLPNAWGLYDMLGNVWEWVTPSGQHMLRGGSFTVVPTRSGSTFDRASYRNSVPEVGNPVQLRRPDVGFRCAGDETPQPVTTSSAAAPASAPASSAVAAPIPVNSARDGQSFIGQSGQSNVGLSNLGQSSFGTNIDQSNVGPNVGVSNTNRADIGQGYPPGPNVHTGCSPSSPCAVAAKPADQPIAAGGVKTAQAAKTKQVSPKLQRVSPGVATKPKSQPAHKVAPPAKPSAQPKPCCPSQPNKYISR